MGRLRHNTAYIRNSWGNRAGAVSPKDVTALR